jgi:hypothetical protein
LSLRRAAEPREAAEANNLLLFHRRQRGGAEVSREAKDLLDFRGGRQVRAVDASQLRDSLYPGVYPSDSNPFHGKTLKDRTL